MHWNYYLLPGSFKKCIIIFIKKCSPYLGGCVSVHRHVFRNFTFNHKSKCESFENFKIIHIMFIIIYVAFYILNHTFWSKIVIDTSFVNNDHNYNVVVPKGFYLKSNNKLIMTWDLQVFLKISTTKWMIVFNMKGNKRNWRYWKYVKIANENGRLNCTSRNIIIN